MEGDFDGMAGEDVAAHHHFLKKKKKQRTSILGSAVEDPAIYLCGRAAPSEHRRQRRTGWNQGRVSFAYRFIAR
jgi:hypothetical protein